MAENLVFYTITGLFSLIFLGLNWETRDQNILSKTVLVTGILAIVLVGVLASPSLAALVDIRTVGSWLLAETEPVFRRPKGWMAMIVFGLYIYFLVLCEQVLIYWIKRCQRSVSKST